MLFLLLQAASPDWTSLVASGGAVAVVFGAYATLVADVRKESRERENRALDVISGNTAAMAASTEVSRETGVALRELRGAIGCETRRDNRNPN